MSNSRKFWSFYAKITTTLQPIVLGVLSRDTCRIPVPKRFTAPARATTEAAEEVISRGGRVQKAAA